MTTGVRDRRAKETRARERDRRVFLAAARKSYVRLVAQLDRALDRFTDMAETAGEGFRPKEIDELVRQTQRALQTVLDQEARLESLAPAEADGALDLDAARDEITSRLARLAGCAAAEGVS